MLSFSRNTVYPAGAGLPASERLGALLAVMLAVCMASLDTAIANTALPTIARDLQASDAGSIWVISGYQLAMVAGLLPAAALGEILGHRRVYIVGLVMFVVSSLACGLAPSLPALVVARILQGLGAAGVMSVNGALLRFIYPSHMLGRGLGLNAMVVGLSFAAGPTAASAILLLGSWHWLFLINVVPGAAATLIAWTLVDFDEPDYGLLKRLDLLALAGLAMFLGSLEYVLEEGAKDDWFQDATIRTLSVVTVVGAALFFWRCFAAEEPLVDLRAYKDRNFAVGSLLTFVMGVGLYGMTYLYPVFLGRVRGYDSLQIGETVFVSGLFMFLTAPVVGALSRKADPRWLIATGFVGFALSCLDLTWITGDWAFWELFVPQALRGISLMLCMVPINVVSLATLPPSKLKNASGLFNLMRNLGGAFGLAFINTFLNERQDLHMLRLRESVIWGRQVAEERLSEMTQAFSARMGSDAELAAIKQLSNQVRQQGLVLSFGDLFWALSILFVAIVLLVPLISRPKPGATAAPAH